MKKLILATAIAGLSVGTAQAATVYKAKGLTYNIKGDIQVQLASPPDVDAELGVDYDDLEIKNGISYELNNDMSAIAGLDFGFKDAAEDDNNSAPEVEEAYLGMEFSSAQVVFGKTDSAADEFGMEQSIEGPDLNEDQFDGNGAEDGDDLIRVDTKLGAVDLVAAYELEAEDDNSDFFDIFIGGDFGGVSVGAAYQDLDQTTTWGIQAAFDAEVVEVMGDYSVSDVDGTDSTTYNLAVAAPVAQTTKARLGVVNVDDESAPEDVMGWYANVIYKFPTHKNVRVFAEIAGNDVDDTDTGYLAGMRIKF